MKPGELLKAFIALFYPRVCNACGETLISGEECICSFCQFHLPKTNLHNQQDNILCQTFWGRIPLETATALYYYQKGCKVQHLIHQFKYHGKTEIGIYLGNILGKQLKASPLYKHINVIVPVPLHPEKKHRRGFNQSEVFAMGISQSMGVPLDVSSLIRETATASQTRKSRFRRWENVESVFTVARPESLKNRNILLVDDVITTGATMEACVQKLLAVRGVKVWLASIAMAV